MQRLDRKQLVRLDVLDQVVHVLEVLTGIFPNRIKDDVPLPSGQIGAGSRPFSRSPSGRSRG